MGGKRLNQHPAISTEGTGLEEEGQRGPELGRGHGAASSPMGVQRGQGRTGGLWVTQQVMIL